MREFEKTKHMTIIPGADEWAMSVSPTNEELAVVFAGDEIVGSLCACTYNREHEPQFDIHDCLFIYDVASFEYPHLENEIEFCWSESGEQLLLKLNQQPCAVFDFKNKRGCCKSGHPETVGCDWPQENHDWDEAMLGYFDDSQGIQ